MPDCRKVSTNTTQFQQKVKTVFFLTDVCYKEHKDRNKIRLKHR